MSKSSHTPGPWYVGVRPEYDVDQITGDFAVGGPTGYVEYDHECGVYAIVDDEPEIMARPWREADARLIAAAPDLLAACFAMLGTWGGQDEDVITKARDMARAAIDKALGTEERA